MAWGNHISVYAFKPRFQTLLRPSTRALHRLGITANQITVGAGLVSVAIGVLLAANPHRPELFLVLPVWLFLRMACNAIDGMLAREFDATSRLGAYLNELSDVVSDAALYLPFAFVPGSSLALGALVIFLSSVAELAGVLGAVVGRERRNDGPMGKSDRALVFGVVGLLLACGVAPAPWLTSTLAVIAALLVVTIVNRVRHGAAGHRVSSLASDSDPRS